MRKIVALLLIAVLCMGIACPALADEFVPSITDKDAPDIVPVLDDEGNECLGLIMDENGEVVDYLYEECLVITALADAKTSTEIPDAAEEMLLKVYDELVSGTTDLPYEKFNANLDPSTMVVRDLYDVSWRCGENSGFADHPNHPEMVEPKGITICLTFNLNVSKNTDVYTMSFKNGAWNPIVSTVNNGDGTVSCTFEDFCPVSFSVGAEYNEPPAQTGDNSMIFMWIVLLAVAVLGLAAVLVIPAIKKNR